MSITNIDFYAENPIHDKTLDNTNIYDAITGNSTNILDITNPSQDIRITNTEGIIFNANNDISLSTQADYNQIIVGNQNITTVGTMYYNYFGPIPGAGFTPKHVYFGQYASTGTTVHFIDNAHIKIPGGLNGQVLSTDGAGNLSYITPSSGGVIDGDYGDITVSSSGSVWTIDNSVVTYGKMQNASGHSVLGRSANTSGAIGEITSTANGQVLHRNGSNLVFATIGDSSITASSITYSRLQNVSTNNRLLGRSTAGAGSIEEITVGSGLTLSAGTLSAGVADGDKGDITVTGSGSIWTIDPGVVTGSKIGNFTITGTNIASNTITESNIQGNTLTNNSLSNSAGILLTKLASQSTSQLIGTSSTSGTVTAITLGTNLTMSGTTLNASGGGGSSYLTYQAYKTVNQTTTNAISYTTDNHLFKTYFPTDNTTYLMELDFMYQGNGNPVHLAFYWDGAWGFFNASNGTQLGIQQGQQMNLAGSTSQTYLRISGLIRTNAFTPSFYVQWKQNLGGSLTVFAGSSLRFFQVSP